MTHDHFDLHDLGRGTAGTALAHGVYARTSGDWEQALTTAKALTAHPVTTAECSLYQGVPAVAYALSAAANPLYEATLCELDATIGVLVEQRLSLSHRRIDQGRAPRTREYDLISGLTGFGAYLLHRGRHPHTLSNVLHYLVRLLEEPVTVAGHVLPGWWSADAPRSRPAEHGHANFGLAHGIAGPVALLALSARAGHIVPGQAQALAYACQLFAQWQLCQPGGAPGWPETLTLTEWQRHEPPSVLPARPSWCYGTPGIARALQLAALAHRSEHHQRLAENTLWACLEDSRQMGHLTDLTVCHGWAGLLLAADRVAADAPEHPQSLTDLKDRFASAVRARASPDTAGLLTGTDGILLALRTLNGSHPVDPRWQTCLLLT